MASLSDYQQEIEKFLQTFKKPHWEPLSELARLIEEVGELARAYNHKFGDKVKKPDEAEESIPDEMADILIGLMAMANNEGIDLDAALRSKLDKVYVRDKDRFEKKQP